MRTILSLFDYSGVWSKPYRKAGYNILQVEIRCGMDVVLFPSLPSTSPRKPREYRDVSGYQVHGILAAPPCTFFSGSGAKHPRTDEQIKEGLALVDAVFRLVYVLKPVWWAMENPVGKLRKWIGPPKMSFNPCDYGDPYKKRTLLWGHFSTALPLNRVVPQIPSPLFQKLGGKSEKTKELRSATPPGFAQAFFKANP